MIDELNSSVNLQVDEIKKLKHKYSSLVNSQEMSYPPTPIMQKLSETGDGFHRIPNRLRGSSVCSALHNTMQPRSKLNKTGIMISKLIKKLSNKQY